MIHLPFRELLLVSNKTNTPVTNASSQTIPNLPLPYQHLSCLCLISWQLQGLCLPDHLVASGAGYTGALGDVGEQVHGMLVVSVARGGGGRECWLTQPIATRQFALKVRVIPRSLLHFWLLRRESELAKRCLV